MPLGNIAQEGPISKAQEKAFELLKRQIMASLKRKRRDTDSLNSVQYEIDTSDVNFAHLAAFIKVLEENEEDYKSGKKKAMRIITIYVPEEILVWIDLLVPAFFPSRSECIRVALKDFVQNTLNQIWQTFIQKNIISYVLKTKPDLLPPMIDFGKDMRAVGFLESGKAESEIIEGNKKTKKKVVFKRSFVSVENGEEAEGD